MELLAPKSQHLEGFMLPTFSSFQWRDVQKSSGLRRGCGAVADPGVGQDGCEDLGARQHKPLVSGSLFWSGGLFPAFQQHSPGGLGEVTLSLLTFISLPGKGESTFFAPMALRGC